MVNHQQLLEKIVRNFSHQDLLAFLRVVNGGFQPGNQPYDHYIQSGTPFRNLQSVGQIEFPDARRLMVITGRVDKELTSRSGKRQQYDLAKKLLKDESYDAGIFVFYDAQGHFRFSLVVAQYLGTRRKFSNYRRYTYFVLPDSLNRTFLDQIGKADFSSIESVTQAFSVEAVTKANTPVTAIPCRPKPRSASKTWNASWMRWWRNCMGWGEEYGTRDHYP